ncbi:hypothetical protein M2650_00420 [Luteimonas sp. SX5]|uniref:HPt domain-containing protein n=1 Tax=Luteimonas galliterrae TaxID=2940486 RepID=A0ABT0MFK3_9GAMM|nr:hypothetical protein [Luteimonas galliterrae]MCL1633115.1 hypothetical protein [Luteimonas galliterrae]
MVNGWTHQLLLAGPASRSPEDADADEIRTETAFDDCPELAALVDMLGPAEVHKVVALLVEVTRADIAALDRAIRAYDYDQATQQLHRIVGSYHLLGPSALADEGRELLAELRTERSPSTLPRLWLYRDRVMALATRLEKTVAAPHGQVTA